MKKILMIAGVILIAVLLSAGGFWGGMTYQSNQADQVRANFMASRGLAGDGQIPSGGLFPNGGQFPNDGQGAGSFAGRGTTGQVKTIDGNVMTVSTAENITTVNLSTSTQIEKSVSGALSDLEPGTRVIVTGQRDQDGNLTASRVQILDFDPQDMANPPEAGTAP